MESSRNTVWLRRVSSANSFERIAIRSDFEKRIPGNSHIAVHPFPIVQLDDCLTGDKFALRVDDLPFTCRGIHSSPKLIALITFNHADEATAGDKPPPRAAFDGKLKIDKLR